MIHRWVRYLSCKPNIFLLNPHLIKADVGTVIMVKPSSINYGPFQGSASFVDPFLFVFALPYCLACPMQPFGHLLGETWTLHSRVCYVSTQFIKIISYDRKICHNINILKQTAYLVINPITAGNFASFNCTPKGRTSHLKTYFIC